MTKRLAGLMAAVVLVASAVIGLSSPAAQAAYCGGSGVGVVVDFGSLGGGVDTGCGSGSKASAAFASAGVTLEQDSGNPGFVCRVEGRPAAGQECLATDAYWALFVSKQGGSWSYATQGVYTQTVKSGDSVAFVWQDSSSRTTPGTAPQPVAAATPTAQASASAPAASASAKPSPTKKKKKSSTPASTTTSGAPSASATATSDASTSASASAGAGLSATPSVSPIPGADQSSAVAGAPSASASEELSSEQTSAAAANTSTDDGLPGWVGPAIVIALILGAGAIVGYRRRAPKVQ